MKNVLIFGVNGYLGGLAAEVLDQNNYRVDGVGTTDQIDDALVDHVFQYFKIPENGNEYNIDLETYDIIMFCISLDHNKSEENYRTTIDINCGILSRLIQLCRALPSPPRLIYLSTQQVYEKQDFENNIVKPNNIYGVTHFLCERLLELYPRSDVIRPSNVYGPPKTQRANVDWTLIPSLIKSALTQNKMTLRNDGSALRNFIFSKDYQSIILELFSGENSNHRIHDFIGCQTASIGYVKSQLSTIMLENERQVTVQLPDDYDPSTESIVTNLDRKNFLKLQKKIWIGSTNITDGIKATYSHYEDI